jgi:predicted component of type VI protein secretion system
MSAKQLESQFADGLIMRSKEQLVTVVKQQLPGGAFGRFTAS